MLCSYAWEEGPIPKEYGVLEKIFPLSHKGPVLLQAGGMSSCSGGRAREGQKYQNAVAFHHNKNSKKTKKILSFPIDGVCDRCRQILEWRKKFRKYKPLTVPRRCCRCQQKTVREAYHQFCKPCAADEDVCAKCLKSAQDPIEENFDPSAECCGALDSDSSKE